MTNPGFNEPETVFEISNLVRDRLAKLRVPATVGYGLRTTKAWPGHPLVHFERDRNGFDVYSFNYTAGPTMHAGQRASVRASASVAVRAEIAVASTVQGAPEWSHNRDAERLADDVVCALRVVLPSQRYQIVGGQIRGRLMPPETEGTLDPGARYELVFAVQRSVLEREGALVHETDIKVSPTVKVRVGGEEQAICGEETP